MINIYCWICHHIGFCNVPRVPGDRTDRAPRSVLLAFSYREHTYYITTGDYEPKNCHQFSMYILSGILWTLDYDNEPPVVKQIELKRCSALAMPTSMQHITGGYEPKNCHKLSIYMFSGISLESRPWQRTTCCEADWVESMQLWRCQQKCNI